MLLRSLKMNNNYPEATNKAIDMGIDALEENTNYESRYSEAISDFLLRMMVEYLNANHSVFQLMELVTSAIATKEQE